MHFELGNPPINRNGVSTESVGTARRRASLYNDPTCSPANLPGPSYRLFASSYRPVGIHHLGLDPPTANAMPDAMNSNTTPVTGRRGRRDSVQR